MLDVNRRAFLQAAALVSLCSNPAIAQVGKRPKVVTTFTIIADMARNVAGDSAEVISLTKPGAEIHEYQPTPSDLVRVSGANLLISNGLNLEKWFERFLTDAKGAASAVVSAGIQPIPIADGAYQGRPNPHAWMSPQIALAYIENIRIALAALDPASADTYSRNAAAYAAKVKAVETPLRQRLAKVPDAKRWLVTSEGAFSYLTRDLGWKEAYLWPINADEQGTPQQVRRLINLVRREQIPVVFSESTVSDKPMRQVARETKARYGGVLYVDSLSEENGPVPTYLSLLEKTVETIAQGYGV